MTTRRHFLALTSAAAASLATSPHRLLAQQPPLPLETTGLPFRSMPADFTGLSYEMPQLYNPHFFSAANTALIAAFRDLSPHGVLRLGGNLSDVTRWQSPTGGFTTPKLTAAIEHGKTYWEWKLTDTSVRANKDGAITPEAIRNLKGFLAATNWKLIYGLNFGSGTPERAADEAAVVAHEIGPALLSFQVGNESDFFGGNRFFRDPGFNFDQYFTGYTQFRDAVLARVPNAPFAGPDTATNMQWVDDFAKSAQLAPKPIVLLSSHFYAMGPASNPAMDAARLLAPNPRLEQQIAEAQKAVTDSGGTPFRMTEGNSCFGGGKPGVSDAFASALWAADYMLHLACAGYAGVNLHGGGDGFYTPIETLTDTSATRRPLFFGMQFANHFAGTQIAQLPLDPATGITAYAAKSNNTLTHIAAINKTPNPTTLQLPPSLNHRKIPHELLLTAPDLAARQGITLAPTTPTSGPTLTLAPYSARLLTFG